MKEIEKFRGWHPQCVADHAKSIELAEARAELRAKLETELLMAKLMRMSKE